MSLYFEIGEVIKTRDANKSSCSKIVCQKKGDRFCDDCFFFHEPAYYCSSLGCMDVERPDGEFVIFQEFKEEKVGGVKQ